MSEGEIDGDGGVVLLAGGMLGTVNRSGWPGHSHKVVLAMS